MTYTQRNMISGDQEYNLVISQYIYDPWRVSVECSHLSRPEHGMTSAISGMSTSFFLKKLMHEILLPKAVVHT